MTADRSGRDATDDPATRHVTGDLGRRQAELVAALVGGGPLPAGFDPRLVGVAREALLRKRAGEVARNWPLLAATSGPGWSALFAGWARDRPTRGSLRDGWDLARELAGRDALPAPAAEELAAREVNWHYDGEQPPRRRRLPAVRRAGKMLLVQVAGRVHALQGGWSRRR